MTPAEARNAMQADFLGRWGEETPVALDNQKYDPPKDCAAWVRLTIQHNIGYQCALGKTGGRYRREGVVYVQIFVQRNTATDDSDELVNKALQIFEGRNASGVTYRNVSPRQISPMPTDAWFEMQVTADFYYDESKEVVEQEI